MKICQINIYYNQGSTGKIVASIHQYLKTQGHQSYVFHGLGLNSEDETVIKIANDKLCFWYGRLCRLIGKRFLCAPIETLRLIHKLDELKPDIVHIHCMNCYYINPVMLFHYLGRINCKVLITNHADMNFTANCDCAFDCMKWKTGCGNCPYDKGNFHSMFFDRTHSSWQSFYNGFMEIKNLYVSSVSVFTNKRAVESPFFKHAREFKVIENGIDTSIFKYHNSKQNNNNAVLHVTPNYSDPNKGFLYVIKMARQFPNISFIIVGVDVLPNMPSNMIFMSKITDASNLACIYSSVNVTLLTSRSESFSLVCAESLCCGTPVVGFRSGGPETIAISDFSTFVEYGNEEALRSSLEAFLNRKWDKRIISNLAQQKYKRESMAEKYLGLYKEIVTI